MPVGISKTLDKSKLPNLVYIATITNDVQYANANRDAETFVDRDIISDPGIYPPADIRERLFSGNLQSSSTTRLINRLWTTVKSGR